VKIAVSPGGPQGGGPHCWEEKAPHGRSLGVLIGGVAGTGVSVPRVGGLLGRWHGGLEMRPRLAAAMDAEGA